MAHAVGCQLAGYESHVRGAVRQPRRDGMLDREATHGGQIGGPKLVHHGARGRFGNRLFLIDTGMLTTYFKGGRPSALEIVGNRVTAIYPDEREELVK